MSKDGEKFWWLSWWHSAPSKSDNEEAARGKGEATKVALKKKKKCV